MSMLPRKVFVVRQGDQYWQDGPPDSPCWGWLSGRYTRVWKTRHGAERFIATNFRDRQRMVVEEVSENEPRSAWR